MGQLPKFNTENEGPRNRIRFKSKSDPKFAHCLKMSIYEENWSLIFDLREFEFAFAFPSNEMQDYTQDKDFLQYIA